MLDEQSMMEKKKQNRTNSVQPKLSGAECKGVKQDVSVNKINRVGRRRESPCPRPDPWRKPNPQKYKEFDKRPKSRGFHDERDRNNVTRGSGAEVGSALQQGSKKLNLNHLLNFTYSPRGGHPSNWGNSTLRNRSKWNTKKHKYNKEQFLQANCQFVVRVGGDYAIHAVDPDLLVEWDAIELVRLPSHEVPSCPICLYQPVAAKMTRCGHIYCWPCMLHYLALSDKTWRKCPICFEAVHKSDLKSVVSLTTHEYLIGEEISLSLMRREKGSVFAMAKVQWKDRRGELLAIDDADENTCFAKILTASPEQVLNVVVKRERQELKLAFAESYNDPENCFIEAALESLTEREKNLIMTNNISAKPKTNPDSTEEISFQNGISPDVKTIVYSCAFSNEERQISDEFTQDLHKDTPVGSPNEVTRIRKESSESFDGGATADELDIDDSCGIVAEKTNKDVYHFYQASNGQHVYMHGLNAHMLIEEYGSLENSPALITAKIVEKEGVTMSEELRKRLRYLSHLPLSCEFEVVELKLTPPVVSVETLKSFEGEVEKRRRRRSKRERDELRRERHIQEEEKRKLGMYPKAKLNLESRRQFPDCVSRQSDVPGGSSEVETPVLSPTSSVLNTTPVMSDFWDSPCGSLEENSTSAPSFAQMLRTGKAKPEPNLPKSQPQPIPLRRTTSAESDSESENYAPVPDFHTSFGDAIQAAILKATTDKADDSPNDQSGSKKKKKGGKQKQLLFTTSMSRSK